MKKLIIYFIIIVAILLSGGYYFYKSYNADLTWTSQDKENNGEETKQKNNQSILASIGENVVVVMEQPPSKEIIIQGVRLAKSGHLSIHKIENGAIGPIIGAVENIPAGESRNIKVTLNELYANGDVFVAILRGDDGNGVFDPTKDLPILNREGEMIMMQFRFNDRAPNPEKIPTFL